MSQCTNCGTELVVGGASCPFCGSAQIVQSQEPVTQFQDLAIEQQEFVTQATEDKPKKKSKKRLLIILSSVVSIAAILVVVGLLTNWFGLVSPIQGLINATVNTFDAKNMTLQYSFEYENDYYAGFDYCEEYDILLNFDPEKGDVAYLTENEYSIHFLDNGESGYYRKDSEYGDIYVDEDAEERIDDLQDALNEDNIDWDKLTETCDLEDYIKGDGANGFFKKLYKECLCDKNWLKENLGYKKTDDTYEFVFDADRLEKFLEEVLRLSDETDALTRDAERAIKQTVRDLKRDGADETAKITFSFTVKDKKLEKIQVVAKGEYFKRTMTLEFSKIGKTDVYEAIDDAHDKIESASCTVCGSYGYMYTKNGRKYCWRCYEDRYHDFFVK